MHEEYEEKWREMQNFVLRVGLHDRFFTQRDASGTLWRSAYQVYWNDGWVTLGEELDPFGPNRSSNWWSDSAEKLRAAVVDLLV